MACRFPQCHSLEEFWFNLEAGFNGVSCFEPHEMRKSGVADNIISSSNYIPVKGVIEDAEFFDAAFFGMSPREVELTDPQHRLFLETAWHAMENAGYVSDQSGLSIGVFGGSNLNSYMLLNMASEFDLSDQGLPFDIRIGNDKDYLTTRVSYKLNLTGPSIAVQTACSTSLTAIHLACESLHRGECEMALAGAVSVKFPLHSGHVHEPDGIYPADGFCRPFDAEGSGPPDGDGVGIVVLKPLSDAERDKDNILAVIKGTAINNDGAAKLGFSAPAMQGQADVIRKALDRANVAPETIDYIETHGTATRLGDAIELAALAEVYPHRAEDYAIGSVKSNIGHLNTASGIAGFIKTVLALKNRTMPPTVNHNTPNPLLALDERPFRVVTKVQPWPAGSELRRAAVSSFGIGATNAHVILEEYEAHYQAPMQDTAQLLPLSAKTEDALESAKSALARLLNTEEQDNLPNVAHTLQVGRMAFARRTAVVANSNRDAIAALKDKPGAFKVSGMAEDGPPQLVFMFPGMGEQYPRMAKDLYQSETAFRVAITDCLDYLPQSRRDNVLKALFPETTAENASTACGNSFREMLETAKAKPEVSDPIDQVECAHIVLFIVEYALARTVMAWGIAPTAMIGYSIGEYVAACLSGVFSLQDAIRLITARADLVAGLEAGAMLAVSAASDKIEPLLPEGVSLSAVNGPLLSVVSGTREVVLSFAERLAREDIVARPLAADYAFHSDLMSPIVPDLTKVLGSISMSAPEISFVSNVTGSWITENQAVDPDYWAQHLSHPVMFADGLLTLSELDDVRFVEIGPGNSLCNIVRQNFRDIAVGRMPVPFMRHRYESRDDREVVTCAMARLWVDGVDVDWGAFRPNDSVRRMALPGYCFDRRRYTLKPRNTGSEVGSGPQEDRLKEADWLYLHSWQRAEFVAAPAEVSQGQCVMVFADQTGVAEEIAHKVVAREGRVVTVSLGTRFTRTGSSSFAIDIHAESDYRSLFRVLSQEGVTPSHILYGAPLGEGFVPDDAGAVQGRIDSELKSLIFLCRNFPVQQENDIRLIVLTRNAHSIVGTEEIDPLGAMLWGLEKVIGQEFPNILSRCLDLPDLVQTQRDRIVEAAAVHVLCSSGSGALRGNRIWVPMLAELPVVTAVTTSDLPPVRTGGIYVVAGGLGHVGLTLARAIAEIAKVTLILLNRSIADRGALAASLRHQIALRRIEDIEALGSKICLLKVDVTDANTLGLMIDGIREEHGPIRGVINAAGVGGGTYLELRSAKDFDAVLAPKVYGTLALDQATQPDIPDFFVLCSSISALCGGRGQGDHSASNAFLDAYCDWRNDNRPGRTISINWDFWSEAGLGLEAIGGIPVEDRVSTRALEAAPLLDGARIGPAGTVIFEKNLSVESEWILSEHKVNGHSIFPGTAYLEAIRQAAAVLSPGMPVDIRDVAFVYPCFVSLVRPRKIEIVFASASKGLDVEVYSTVDYSGREVRTLHCSCSISYCRPDDARPLSAENLAQRTEKDKGTQGTLPTDCPLFFGPRWQNYVRIWPRSSQCLAQISLPDEFLCDLDLYPMHPAMLDIATSYVIQGHGFYMPISYGRLISFAPFERDVLSIVHVGLDAILDQDVVTLDFSILSRSGSELVRVEGITLKRIPDVEANLAEWVGGDAGTAIRKVLPTQVGDSRQDAFLKKRVRNGIRTEEGRRILQRVLSMRLANRVVATTIEPEDWLPRDDTGVGVETDVLCPVKTYDRPSIGTEFIEPETPLEKDVAEIFGKVMGLTRVGANDDFFELGGDSLKGIKLIREITERTPLSVSISDLYRTPTVRQLASLYDLQEIGHAQ
ncbi:MAG: SDR family oxidoreductase [Proteobacteria bacterium]|nr:SDR family oxidoreductase [Pseudomonadota bacterium]